MKTISRMFRTATEGFAALMMAAIFCTFILQIVVRYAVGSSWFTATFGGVIDASYFGWTVEFILVLWLWTIFWGNAFVVRDRDHVTFDMIYNIVGRKTRTVLAIVGALIIVAALWSSIGPTYDRMKLLRLKSSATLPVKMLPIYSIYFVFLGAVGLRYLWRAWDCMRHSADRELHVLPFEETIHEGKEK
ncbi:TRAP transporter small permease subunit [Sulfitobacter sp. G21635-S1]|jgi:C4-dicarboxylate transporter DctQ subunit|nr:TRAP transporter small permease subunit [Sulfitobacter sp. G21635-S1]GLT10753.1 C4-dicarboxylate ABC transporter permease [Sulfitobacter porphyrae]